jgi:hypothetical protein
MTLVDLLLNQAKREPINGELVAWLLENSNDTQALEYAKTAQGIPVENLWKLAKSRNVDIRLAIAKRTTNPEDLKATLRKDPSARVANAAGATRKRGKLPSEVRTMDELYELDLSSWEDVKTLLGHPFATQYLGEEEDEAYILSKICKTHPTHQQEVRDQALAWFEEGKLDSETYAWIARRLWSDIGLDGARAQEFGQKARESGVLPAELPEKWITSTSWLVRQLAAAHPKATEKQLLTLVQDPDDDPDVVITTLWNPGVTDKVLLTWVKKLRYLPDESELPLRLWELVEELHDLGGSGELRLLASLGNLSDEELEKGLTGSDLDLARDLISLKQIKSEHLLKALSSLHQDSGRDREALLHPRANTEVRLAWASKYPVLFSSDLLEKIPNNRVLDLPALSLITIGANMEDTPKVLIFEKEMNKLVKKHGKKALTLLDASATTGVSMRELVHAINDTLG